MYNCIVLRYGEVGIKSKKKRPFFERLYVQSLQEALKKARVTGQIINCGGRFIIATPQVDELLDVLQVVPGLQSFSPAHHFSFTDLEDLLEQASVYAQDWVKDSMFRVSARRHHAKGFSSMQVAALLGEKLLPYAKGVSLHDPQVTVHIEVRGTDAYIFKEWITGLGGMPATSSGKVVSLFSGGVDSPVAAFEMLKRGCQVDFLFINLGSTSSFTQVARIYNYMVDSFAFNYKPKLICVDGRGLITAIGKNVPASLRQLALKIGFYELAGCALQDGDYTGAVTGESLAQKSTQTLAGLNFISQQVPVFMLRPLLSRDKLDIISIARRIGTFCASQHVEEFCDISEGHVVRAIPQTRDAQHIPSFENLARELWSKKEVYQGMVELTEQPADSVSLDATIFDVRLPSQARHDPLPRASPFYFYDVLSDLSVFDKKKSYVFVCEHGVQAQLLADELSSQGIRASACSVEAYKKMLEEK